MRSALLMQKLILRNCSESITKNGKPVAVMQSPERKKNTQALEAFNKLNAIGAKISARNSKNAISVSELHEIKNDGRKY